MRNTRPAIEQTRLNFATSSCRKRSSIRPRWLSQHAPLCEPGDRFNLDGLESLDRSEIREVRMRTGALLVQSDGLQGFHHPIHVRYWRGEQQLPAGLEQIKALLEAIDMLDD